LSRWPARYWNVVQKLQNIKPPKKLQDITGGGRGNGMLGSFLASCRARFFFKFFEQITGVQDKLN